MQKIYQKSLSKGVNDHFSERVWKARDSLRNAEISVWAKEYFLDEAEKKVQIAKEELKAAKELEKIEKEKLASEEKALDESKIWRKKVKRRLFIAGRTVMEEDDMDPSKIKAPIEFTHYIFPQDKSAAKKARKDEVNEKLQCKVCFHRYSDERPEAIIIPCAHKFCFNCISTLPEKKCPNCRAKFTNKNVYKTH